MGRLMQTVILHEIQGNVLVYLDDILIVSTILKEPFDILRRMILLQQIANFTIYVEIAVLS